MREPMTPEERIIIALLIGYAYSLGGSTREISRITGIPHDDIVDLLVSTPRGATIRDYQW
jgi:hypothetical protein